MRARRCSPSSFAAAIGAPAPIGLLLAEARGALDEAAAELDRKARELTPGGWPEIQERLTAAHPTAEDYLPQFARIWRACRDMAIEHDLVTWPDAPIRYVPIPAHTRDVAPQLYYLVLSIAGAVRSSSRFTTTS